MARQKKAPPKEPLRVYTIKVTPVVEQTLQQLSQDASDHLGWTVSNSAVIRALIQHAGKQSPAWISSALYPPLEWEIAQGRVWGSKKKGYT